MGWLRLGHGTQLQRSKATWRHLMILWKLQNQQYHQKLKNFYLVHYAVNLNSSDSLPFLALHLFASIHFLPRSQTVQELKWCIRCTHTRLFLYLEAMYFNSKKDQNQHHLTISVNIDEPGPLISFLWFACADTALNGVWDYKTRISLEEIDYWLSKTIGRGE